MPTTTYTPLANITLGSSASSITFSSISQIYRDLVLVVSGTVTVNVSSHYIKFNSDSGANYSRIWISGNGTGASSSMASAQTALYPSGDARFDTTSVGMVTINVMDYSVTDKHKSVLARNGNASGANPGTDAIAGRWASTSAITTIQVGVLSNNFATGTTFALYGIAS